MSWRQWILARSWQQWTLAGISVAACVVLVFAVYTAWELYNFSEDVHSPHQEPSRFQHEEPLVDDQEPRAEQEPPPMWEGTERVNILLLGGDSRDPDHSGRTRTDTMMVVSLDPQGGLPVLFSVLRDTYTAIPGYRSNRLNAAMALGGPSLTMKTVSNVMGIPIQYYVFTDWLGFVAVVDALGGIEYTVDRDMFYVDSNDDPEYHIDLEEGLQQLNGLQALQLVRFRQEAMSDFRRTERQRGLLQALANKAKQRTSLLRLPRMLNSLAPHVETNLTLGEMLRLTRLSYETDMSTMVTAQIPPFEMLRDEMIDNQAVLTYNQERLLQYVQQTFEVQEDDFADGIN